MTNGSRVPLKATARTLKGTLLGLTAAVMGLTACTSADGAPTVDYDHAVDVSIFGWSASDTLFYPIAVTEQPEVRTPLLHGHDYKLRCFVRTTSDCQLSYLPISFILQQLSEEGNVERNILRTEIKPEVRDEEGHSAGDSWGSLYQQESDIKDVSIRFDSAGDYRILLTPMVTGQQTIKGVASVGISLSR